MILKNKILTFLPFLLLLPLNLLANDIYYSEDWHVRNWCNSPSTNSTSTVEAVQNDKTRVDCLTKDFAYEFDWAKKYNEAIGQSLGYSIRTGRRPGIVLIMKSDQDIKYWNRLQEIILKFNLPIQTLKIKAIKK